MKTTKSKGFLTGFSTFVLIMAFLALPYCGSDDPAGEEGTGPTITLSPTEDSLSTSEAGSATVNLTATKDLAWTATADKASWCSVDPDKGTGTGSAAAVTVSADANMGAQRTCVVMFSAAGATSKTFTLTQPAKGDTGGMTDSAITLASSDGSLGSGVGMVTVNLTATTGLAWTATADETSWCSVSPAFGTGSERITVRVTANTGAERTCAVTFMATGATAKTFTLTQTAGVAITLSPVSRDLPTSLADMTAVTLAVTPTALAWTAAADETSWCTVTPTSGMGGERITVSVTANTGAKRTCMVTFTATDATPAIFTLTQPDSTIVSSISLSSEVAGLSSEMGRIAVTLTATPAGLAWTAAADETSWCSVAPARGNGTTAGIMVSATANAGALRTCEVTFAATGATDKTFTLTQASPGMMSMSSITLMPATFTLRDGDVVGNTTVALTAGPVTVAWTATSSASSWCTVTPNSGTGSRTGIMVSAAVNATLSQRTCTVTFSDDAGEADDAEFTLIQAAGTAIMSTITLNPTSFALPSSMAGNTTTDLTVDPDTVVWSTSKNQTWCTVTPDSGTEVTITVAITTDNTSTTDARECTVTFMDTATGPNAATSKTFTLTQPRMTTVDTSTLSLSSGGAELPNSMVGALPSVTLTVDPDTVAWTAAADETSWCSVAPASGTGSATYTITVEATGANPSVNPRNCEVTFMDTATGPTAADDVTFTLTQPGTGGSFTLPVAMGTASNSEDDIDIGLTATLGLFWTGTTSEAWCTFNSNNSQTLTGTGTGSEVDITVDVAENLNLADRPCTIEFAAASVTTVAFTLTQDGAPPMLALSADEGSTANHEAGNVTVGLTATLGLSWTTALVSVPATPVWCEVDPDSGTGTGSAAVITVRAVTDNASETDARECRVTFSATGATAQTFTLTQSKLTTVQTATMTFLPTEAAISNTGGTVTTTLTVTANFRWNAVIAGAPSWCTIPMANRFSTAADNDGSPVDIVVTIGPYTGSTNRECVVTFSVGDRPGVITVLPDDADFTITQTASAGTLFAVGGSATTHSEIFRSDDSGVTWTIERAVSIGGPLYGIAASSSRLVAVGENVGTPGSPQIVRSSDMLVGTAEWDILGLTGHGTSTLRAITYSGDRFVAVGSNGTIRWSTFVPGDPGDPDATPPIDPTPDAPAGDTWTSVSLANRANVTVNLNDIAVFGTNELVAVGGGGTIITSTDNGLNWTAQTSGVSNPFRAVIVSGSRLVVVGLREGGGQGPILTSDDDGVTWTSRTSGVTGHLNDVIVSGSVLVAVGQYGAVTRGSANGNTWDATGITLPSGFATTAFRSVTLSGGALFVVGAGRSVLTSTDSGANWTAVTSVGGSGDNIYQILNVLQ